MLTMKTLDGSDIKYRLSKKRIKLKDIGEELGVTTQAVHNIIWGKRTSQRIKSHIERLLDMKPDTLVIKEIKKECRSQMEKVA